MSGVAIDLVWRECGPCDETLGPRELIVRIAAAPARAEAAGASAKGQDGPGMLEFHLSASQAVHVLVKAGDEIEAEHGVLTVEAMKMENEIRTPKAGRVIEVRVTAGQTVEKGEVLAIIE